MAMGESLGNDPSFRHLSKLARRSMPKSMMVVQEFGGKASMRKSVFFIHDDVRPVRSIKTEDYFSTGSKVTVCVKLGICWRSLLTVVAGGFVGAVVVFFLIVRDNGWDGYSRWHTEDAVGVNGSRCGCSRRTV
jgi:hypothetical protein